MMVTVIVAEDMYVPKDNRCEFQVTVMSQDPDIFQIFGCEKTKLHCVFS